MLPYVASGVRDFEMCTYFSKIRRGKNCGGQGGGNGGKKGGCEDRGSDFFSLGRCCRGQEGDCTVWAGKLFRVRVI